MQYVIITHTLNKRESTMKTVFASKLVSLQYESFGKNSKFLSLVSAKLDFDLTLAFGEGFPTISLKEF